MLFYFLTNAQKNIYFFCILTIYIGSATYKVIAEPVFFAVFGRCEKFHAPAVGEGADSGADSSVCCAFPSPYCKLYSILFKSSSKSFMDFP